MLTSQKPHFSTNYSRNGAKEVFGESTIFANCLYLLHTYLCKILADRRITNCQHLLIFLTYQFAQQPFFSLHNKDTFAICRQARPSAIDGLLLVGTHVCALFGCDGARVAAAAEQQRGAVALRCGGRAYVNPRTHACLKQGRDF